MFFYNVNTTARPKMEFGRRIFLALKEIQKNEMHIIQLPFFYFFLILQKSVNVQNMHVNIFGETRN